MKNVTFFKASMIAFCGAALTLTSCGGSCPARQNRDSTAGTTPHQKKATYTKKNTNTEF